MAGQGSPSPLPLASNATNNDYLPLSSTEDINVGFTLLSAYLVFFMQAGFAMLSAGSVRSKNAKNIILYNLLDACCGCIAWYATGYAFAYGDPSPSSTGTYPYTTPFIGHQYFFQIGLPRTDYVTWFFQFTFAATSATIVSGAVAERCKFESYICYNFMLVAVVYPVVAHWVWSPFGWMSALRTPATASGGYTLLFGSGVYDFAGDGPVHMVGGFASLVGAWILGPRIGRFDANGHPVDMPGHNASLTLLGVFLLWFGWFGFNPGSTNAIIQNATTTSSFVPGFSSIAASIAINTTISAAAATLVTLVTATLHTYFTMKVVVWDLIIAGNGALAGLVSITGPCAFVDTWGAVVIGAVGGFVYYCCSRLMLYRLRIDDPLDATAVHAGCGAWGMIGGALLSSSQLVEAWYGPLVTTTTSSTATAMIATTTTTRPYGLFMGGGGQLLAAHVIYILVIAAWTIAIMTPFFYLLKKAGIMRVPPNVEIAGLDVSYHGGSSYPGHEMNSMAVVRESQTELIPLKHGGIRVHTSMSAAGVNSIERQTSGVMMGGGGGGAMHSIVEEAVMLALAEVERRGWQPPPRVQQQQQQELTNTSSSGMMTFLPTHMEDDDEGIDGDSNDGNNGHGDNNNNGGNNTEYIEHNSNGDNNTNTNDGDDGLNSNNSNSSGEMKKSQSLAEMQSMMQKQYMKSTE